jgi:hypothetical protein
LLRGTALLPTADQVVNHRHEQGVRKVHDSGPSITTTARADATMAIAMLVNAERCRSDFADDLNTLFGSSLGQYVAGDAMPVLR